MADEEWTVKDLMEAFKRFPLEAKVYLRDGAKWPRNDRRGATNQGLGDEDMGVLNWNDCGAWLQATSTRCNCNRAGSNSTSPQRGDPI